MAKRRKFTAKFKAEVVLEALRGEMYCTRFFRPLPKGRLCYNDNLD